MTGHRPPCRRALPLLLAVLAAGGCITHRVHVRHHPPLPAEDAGLMPRASALVESGYSHRWGGEAARSDPLPVDLAVTVWSYAPDGELKRADMIVASPRPWWQRFPIDFVTDLMVPDTLYAVGGAYIRPIPREPIAVEVLEREAAAAGFVVPAGDPPDPGLE